MNGDRSRRDRLLIKLAVACLILEIVDVASSLWRAHLESQKEQAMSDALATARELKARLDAMEAANGS